MSQTAMLKVRLVRSPIGSNGRQRQTLKALGLTRLGRTAVVQDNAATQGRIRAVLHLIEVQR